MGDFVSWMGFLDMELGVGGVRPKWDPFSSCRVVVLGSFGLAGRFG